MGSVYFYSDLVHSEFSVTFKTIWKIFFIQHKYVKTVVQYIVTIFGWSFKNFFFFRNLVVIKINNNASNPKLFNSCLVRWFNKIWIDIKYQRKKKIVILYRSLVFTGPCVDIHSLPATVSPHPDPKERRPGLLHEHVDQRENFFWTRTSHYGFQLCCKPSIPHLTSPQIFNDELFGAVAEEKEVKGIVSKLMEARHSKSMDSYEVLARFCSKESITKLILPLKEVSRGVELQTLLVAKMSNFLG